MGNPALAFAAYPNPPCGHSIVPFNLFGIVSDPPPQLGLGTLMMSPPPLMMGRDMNSIPKKEGPKIRQTNKRNETHA